MKLIYRISDAGYNKVKPNYINNKNCLKNFVYIFGNQNLEVIADNCSKETLQMITKYVHPNKITNVSVGHGAGTFNLALDMALGYDGETIVYFVENDYLHKEESPKTLVEGLQLGSDYVSLYDHPDKYINGANPFVEDGGEVTKVFLSESCHWKLTNSTTMTFASKVKTLREDESILRKWTDTTHPHDFQMFLDLRDKGRTLITPLPGYSTHGETAWLTPLINWNDICNNTNI
jgi:hypothetical protein